LNAHRFFDDEKERRTWQNPKAILTQIGLKHSFTFVDVGCGYGFSALPAAKLVGKDGKVYGLDSNDEAIRKLKEKAAEKGVDNLYLKVGKAEENILCEACADIAFLGIVLHDFNDPIQVLKNSKRMLKPTGKLVKRAQPIFVDVTNTKEFRMENHGEDTSSVLWFRRGWKSYC